MFRRMFQLESLPDAVFDVLVTLLGFFLFYCLAVYALA